MALFGGLFGKMPVYTALAMGIFFAGLGLPGTTPSMRARFLTLLFDALSPAAATPLPPLNSQGDDLRSAISGITRR